MSQGRKLLMATIALAGGFALAHGARAQFAAPIRFDPFNPEASLNAPDGQAPATQPAMGTGTPPRPIVRDAIRPPTRSPFRP